MIKINFSNKHTCMSCVSKLIVLVVFFRLELVVKQLQDEHDVSQKKVSIHLKFKA